MTFGVSEDNARICDLPTTIIVTKEQVLLAFEKAGDPQAAWGILRAWCSTAPDKKHRPACWQHDDPCPGLEAWVDGEYLGVLRTECQQCTHHQAVSQ